MKKLDDEQLSKFLEIDNKIEKKSQEIIERQKSNVEIYKDKETRNNGGLLVNPQTLDTRFDLTKMDPKLEPKIFLKDLSIDKFQSY